MNFEKIRQIEDRITKNRIKLQEEKDKNVENKYQARPPTIVHPYNPNVSP